MRTSRDSLGSSIQKSSDFTSDISLPVIREIEDGVCMVQLANGIKAAGFLCILYSGEQLHRGLFTSNHFISEGNIMPNKDILLISNAQKSQNIRVKSFWFTDENMNVTFIELTEEQVEQLFDLNFRFLQISFNILKSNDKVFLIQNGVGSKMKFVPGSVLEVEVDGSFFYHDCNLDRGASGAPVFNKVGEIVGIHRGVNQVCSRNYAVKIAAVRKAILQNLELTIPRTAIPDAKSRKMEQQLQQQMQELQERQQKERQLLQEMQQKKQLQEMQQKEQQLQEMQLQIQQQQQQQLLQEQQIEERKRLDDAALSAQLPSSKTLTQNENENQNQTKNQKQNQKQNQSETQNQKMSQGKTQRTKKSADVRKVALNDLLLCFGGLPEKHAKKILVFATEKDKKWYRVSKLSCRHVYGAAATLSKTVIIAGNYSEHSDAVEQFDPETNSCHPFPNMLVGRSFYALINLNEVLYAIGGWSESLTALNHVEKFDKILHKWMVAEPLKTSRVGLAATTLQDCILAAGGSDSRRTLNSCELYDSKFMKWSPIASLNKKRVNAAASSHDNSVYVFGGRLRWTEVHDDVEQYDKRTNKWTLLDQRMSVARHGLAAVTVGNVVYLLGGWKADARTDLVESYNFTVKKFTTMQSLPSACDGLTAVCARVSNTTLAFLTDSKK